MKSYEKHNCVNQTQQQQQLTDSDIFYNGKEWIYQIYCDKNIPYFEVIIYCPYCGHDLRKYSE